MKLLKEVLKLLIQPLLYIPVPTAPLKWFLTKQEETTIAAIESGRSLDSNHLVFLRDVTMDKIKEAGTVATGDVVESHLRGVAGFNALVRDRLPRLFCTMKRFLGMWYGPLRDGTWEEVYQDAQADSVMEDFLLAGDRGEATIQQVKTVLSVVSSEAAAAAEKSHINVGAETSVGAVWRSITYALESFDEVVEQLEEESKREGWNLDIAGVNSRAVDILWSKTKDKTLEALALELQEEL